MREQTNERLLGEYLRWLRDTKGRGGATVLNYSGLLHQYLDHLGRRRLDQATPQVIEDFMQRPRGGRAHGNVGQASTRSKDATLVRGFHTWLLNRGYATKNPALLVGTPAVHNVMPRPVPDEVWVRVWGDPALPEEARVVLGLAYFVGLRRHEITKLAPHNFLLPSGRIVQLVRKGSKDDALPYEKMVGVVERHLPHLIPGGAKSFLEPLERAVRERAGRPVLLPWGEGRRPTPNARRRYGLGEAGIDPQLVYKRLDGWFRALGMAPRTFGPHQCRHSTATNLLRAGVPLPMVTTLMNHSSPTVTMRYLKLGGDELGEWLEKNR